MAATLTYALYIALGLIATFALAGFVLLWIVGRRKISRLETHERKRLRAIPFMGDGPFLLIEIEHLPKIPRAFWWF